MGRDSNGEEEQEQEQDKSFTKIPPINISKWEQDKSFGAQFLHESSNMWPMVSIKDSQDSSIVFPPINHENLRTPYNHESHSASFLLYAASSSSSSLSTLSIENDVESSDSTLTFSSSPSSECVTNVTQESRISKLGGIAQWINLGLEVIYSKFKGVLLSFQSTSTARSTAVVALMMGFLYIGFRRRLRRRKEIKDQLRRVIREKDERINQLLHQIAQMNELLMGRK